MRSFVILLLLASSASARLPQDTLPGRLAQSTIPPSVQDKCPARGSNCDCGCREGGTCSCAAEKSKKPEKPKTASKPMNYRIRLIVLKHTNESVAERDAQRAQQAATHAGERVCCIGKSTARGYPSRETLDNWLDKMMKKDAVKGDTFILHTIGHGVPDGRLMELGARKDVLEAIAAAAERNKQKTLWWQLSCFACAQLPDLSTLPKEQQKWLVVVSSSPDTHVSAEQNQADIQAKVWRELVSGKLDTDKDGKIQAGELRSCINGFDALNRGKQLSTIGEDQVVFEPVEWAPVKVKSVPQETKKVERIKPVVIPSAPVVPSAPIVNPVVTPPWPVRGMPVPSMVFPSCVSGF